MKNVSLQNGYVILEGDHNSNDIDLGSIKLELDGREYQIDVCGSSRSFNDGYTIFEIDIDDSEDKETFPECKFDLTDIDLLDNRMKGSIYVGEVPYSLGVLHAIFDDGTIKTIILKNEDSDVDAMEFHEITNLGMVLNEFNYKSCQCHMGEGTDWATIYSMYSSEKGKGHGNELLKQMKTYYMLEKKTFGSTVALSPQMAHLLQKYSIKEYMDAV